MLFRSIFMIASNKNLVGAVAHICHHFFSLRAAVKQVAAHYEFMLRVAVFKTSLIKSRFYRLKKPMNIRYDKIFHLLSPLPFNIFKIHWLLFILQYPNVTTLLYNFIIFNNLVIRHRIINNTFVSVFTGFNSVFKSSASNHDN